MEAVTFCEGPSLVAEKVDALVVVTEWNEFKMLNMLQMRHLMQRPVLLDARNLYEPLEMQRLGFFYCGMGRGITSVPGAFLSATKEVVL